MSTLPQAGDLFEDRYRLHELIGEGGFARVYRATDHELGREVAIKVLKPGDDPGHHTASERFAKEMKLVARVRDPHVVTLYDYGRTADGTMFMVLELIPGRDLQKLLKDGPLSEDEALRVAVQLLHALRAAHNAGALHRDVKPANIRVYEYMGDAWRVKLLDFGIAKTLVDDAGLTATGMAVGTPRFMTPEQLYGEDVGPTTDLYSLAIVIYEMLTGEQLNHLRRLANNEPVEIAADPRIRDPLRHVLNRMLARDPSRRFASADAVLHALEATLPRAAGPPPAGFDRSPTARVNADEVGTHSPHTKRLILLSVLAVSTGAAAGALILMVSKISEQPPTTTDVAPPEPGLIVRDTPRERDTEQPDRVASLEPGDAVPSGCGKAPPHEGLGRLDTADGLRQIEWYVHIPTSYEAHIPHPVVMLFHDDASDPQSILAQTKLANTAEEEGFILVMPRDRTIAPVWRSKVIDDVHVVFEETAARLCVDRQRVFTVGHGAGGNAVDQLTCQDWVTGHAMASYIINDPTFKCAPTKPAALVYFAPMNTGFQPPEGGRGCAGTTKISYDEFERMWRERNSTDDDAEVLHDTPHGTCRRWSGDAPFMSCRVDGGRPWPGSPPRKTDILNCDGVPPKFEFNRVIWEFFQSLD